MPDFADLMFPHPEDRVNYTYPQDGLLQADGIAKDNEIREPQNLEVNGEKTLFVVKNGMTSGTTVGRVNGLESFTRVYPDYGIEHTSTETAILPYNKRHGPFSARGDLGSIIIPRKRWSYRGLAYRWCRHDRRDRHNLRAPLLVARGAD